MKKTLLAIAAVSLLTISSFAQGNVLLGDGPKGIWNITTGNAVVNNQLTWTLIAGPAATTPTVDTDIMTSVPTNNTTAYSSATAWTDITGQAGFFQVDGTNNAPIAG